MSRAGRPPKKALPLAAPLNFLLGCSDADLASYQLARLAAVANLRSQVHELLDKMIDEMGQSALAGWFRGQDRETLKNAIESPEQAIARITTQAVAQIRAGQRSEEELIPLPPLEPGAAHLAAAIRYAERNRANGLCTVCPQPLDRNSVCYCTRHLAIVRARKKPKGAKGGQPGTLDWLYSDVPFESAHNKAPSQVKALKEANEKRAKDAKDNRKPHREAASKKNKLLLQTLRGEALESES
jgi:hypothetical protein